MSRSLSVDMSFVAVRLLTKRFLELLEVHQQGWNVISNDAPEDIVVDAKVAMNELVAAEFWPQGFVGCQIDGVPEEVGTQYSPGARDTFKKRNSVGNGLGRLGGYQWRDTQKTSGSSNMQAARGRVVASPVGARKYFIQSRDNFAFTTCERTNLRAKFVGLYGHHLKRIKNEFLAINDNNWRGIGVRYFDFGANAVRYK
jgi:hypothetical protein